MWHWEGGNGEQKYAASSISRWNNVTATFPGTCRDLWVEYALNVWQIDIGKAFTNLDIEIVAKLTCWEVYTYIYPGS